MELSVGMPSTEILRYARQIKPDLIVMGASSALGGNILRDAFGVVAMVAMTPLITVQLMGLIAELKTRRARKAQPAFALAAAYAELPDDAIIEL